MNSNLVSYIRIRICLFNYLDYWKYEMQENECEENNYEDD